MDTAANSVSVGILPYGSVAAAKRRLHASGVIWVMQPANKLASVAKFAIVGV
jgi:hypothetical protein